MILFITIACTSQPCKNGGLCYNTGNSYFCYCGANGAFTGKNCETSIASPGSSMFSFFLYSAFRKI